MNGPKGRLNELCRLCCKPIKPSATQYSKQKYARDIKLTLNIDVSVDSDELYPLCLCDSCRLKLDRWRKKKNQHGKSPLVNIQLCNWIEYHSNQQLAAAPLPSVIDIAAEEGVKFGLLNWTQDEVLILVKLQQGGLGVERCLKIHKDFTWNFHVWNGKQCVAQCLSAIPKVLDNNSAKDLVHLVGNLYVCHGNIDFQELAKRKVFKGRSHQMVGTTRSYTNQEGSPQIAIHHVSCHGLSSKPVCDVCSMYRSTLFMLEKRRKEEHDPKEINIHSRARNDYLGCRVNEKITELQKQRRNLEAQVSTLKEKMAALLERDSITVENTEEEKLQMILKDVQSQVEEQLKPETPHQLLWQQQQEALKKTDRRQMRWHPAVLRCCIAVFCKSSSAYNLMRKTQFMILPHETTLKKYMQFTVPKPGVMPEVLEYISTDWKIQEDKEYARNITLIFDEMQIKSGLVYSKANGKLIGFTDTGTLSNELKDFDSRWNNEDENNTVAAVNGKKLANQMLVLMARGIFSPMRVPVAFYPTRSASSHTIYHCLWPIVKTLTILGLTVRAFVSDGASWNRKFYHHHRFSTEPGRFTYCSKHPFLRNAKLYFICDVPHLIKTTRNNWENSRSHLKSRNLLYKGQTISWTHLMDLWEWDHGKDDESPGLRKLVRVKYEHVWLSPSMRMRVSAAAQVLSTSVANAFDSQRKAKGTFYTQSTTHFCRMMDKFFDCLNVRAPGDHITRLKPVLAPYTDVNDERFHWLQNDFLGWLKEWEDDAMATPNMTDTQRRKLTLSQQTLEGLRITVNSFIELAKCLLSIDGVNYLLSDKFNQDPLEEYFSLQRAAGGANSQPSMDRFQNNFLNLLVAGSNNVASTKGNCRVHKRSASLPLDETPLPKRANRRTTMP